MDEKMKKRLLMYLIQYGWRDEYEGDDRFVCDPQDYETEEDYLRAKHAWRDKYEDFEVDNFEYESEYLESKKHE